MMIGGIFLFYFFFLPGILIYKFKCVKLYLRIMCLSVGKDQYMGRQIDNSVGINAY